MTMRLRNLIATGALCYALATLAACGGTISPPDQADDPTPAADAGQAPAATCLDRCADGARQCGGGGVQVCGTFDMSGCRIWGPVALCPVGQKCVDGSCESSCVSQCAPGAYECTPDGAGRRGCVLGSDGCWIWATAVACPGGERCSGGACADTCTDECTVAARRCSGNAWQVCGLDPDGCARWGAATACAGTETCSNGACGTQCINECTAASVECSGRTGLRRCGDFDADACLEWGPVTPCPAGQVCSNGTCAAACQDECSAAGERQCTSAGSAYRTCGDFDADGCLEWGLPVGCAAGETCVSGACVATCACDYYRGVCEPQAPGSAAPCACDPDCAGGALPCQADGHCDSWCPAGADPDCACSCQHNEYCEAAAHDSAQTCACDPDCGLHDQACADDGHCDTFCPAGVDPDCGVDACRERWMSIGWRWGSELALDGAVDAPDPTESDPSWVLLSPDGWAGGGSGELLAAFSAEHLACVRSLNVEVYGFDDSVFGEGAKTYLWNWSAGRYDLLEKTLDRPEGLYENVVADATPYLLCGSGAHARCFVDARVSASTWDNSHVLWVELRVFTQP